jgi:hypothetical protein
LPDLFWYFLPKWGKYIVTYTKLPKILQMTIRYTKSFLSNALKNTKIWDFCYETILSGNPGFDMKRHFYTFSTNATKRHLKCAINVFRTWRLFFFGCSAGFFIRFCHKTYEPTQLHEM